MATRIQTMFDGVERSSVSCCVDSFGETAYDAKSASAEESGNPRGDFLASWCGVTSSHDCEIHRLRQRIDASPHEKDKRRIGYGPKQTRIAGIVDGEDRYVLALVSAQLFERLFDEIVPICCDMSRVSCPNCLFDFGAAVGWSFGKPIVVSREESLQLQCRAFTEIC